MNSKRFFILLVGLLILAAGLGVAGVVFGDKLLQKKTHELTELKIQSAVLENQEQALVQAKKDIQKYTELESIAKSIVPQEKDQARTVRELVQIAESSNVKIGSISFPASTLGQAATNASGPAGPTTQFKPVDGIAGLYQMEVNIQSDSSVPVTYTRFLGFLEKLEQSRRTSQITNVTVQPDAVKRDVISFSLIISVYLKP